MPVSRLGWQRAVAVAVVVCGLLALAGCGATPAPAPSPTPALPSVADQALNIYNWDTYIDPAALTDFEQEFGVKIRYDLYESNEAMLATVEDGATDYDIVVPGDYMVEIMRAADLLAPLDKANIPNFGNLDAAFVSPAYDPGNRYCVPYQWGTMGIGYNVKATGRELSGWQDLFDPAFAGRVSLLADPRLTMGVVLLYLGYSPNTTSAFEIAQARDFLIERAAQIAEYAPDTGQDLLADGTVDIAFEWSGDIFQAMEGNPDLRYVIPQEGSIIWTDNLCILATAPHKEMAEKFINYVLEPKVGAAISNYIRFGSPNRAALPLLNPEDRNDPAIYPPDQVRQRLFFLTDVGPAATELYEAAWAEVLAAQEKGD
ncbi:MAG: spermidine/putrescine ABC transporter substrate-binding protein [Anaerolineae bacterium]|nr:spermidine/putrescine ABC transporter substrate-binding protein [Anaerolineae bacterium]